jgi:RNA polymerase sigma-70 factor (ECF subfamily)
VQEDPRAAIGALLPRLRRFGLMLTGSRLDAEELVQDACERALYNLPQLRDQARLDAWMYSIMRNLWVGRLRGGERHHDISGLDIIGADGEAVVESRSTLARVRDALAQLPANQRTVLVLVSVDGMRYREVADILAIPIGTVMSRLHRGRQALHDSLSGSRPGDTGEIVPLRATRSPGEPILAQDHE